MPGRLHEGTKTADQIFISTIDSYIIDPYNHGAQS